MRARVWKNFVERLPEGLGTLSDADVDILSAWKMNGREIRNTMNMVISWCQKHDETLSAGAVEDLIAFVNSFATKEDPSGVSSPGSSGEGARNTGMEDLKDLLLEM